MESALLLNVAEVAEALGIGRSTVYQLISVGELEVVKIGRSTRVPRDALDALIERRRVCRTGSVPSGQLDDRREVERSRTASASVSSPRDLGRT